MKKGLLKYFIIGTFVSLYLVVSVISTIHVIQFFDLTNPKWLSVSLAIAFELGAAASLASLIALDKMNKLLVWILFIVLTAMQAMGNTYYAYTNIHDFQGWSELFGLIEEDVIFQKRILSLISGAILPLVALGFIKSLVDYIKPEEVKEIGSEEKGPEIAESVSLNDEEEDSSLQDLQIDLANGENLDASANSVDVISISEMKEESTDNENESADNVSDLQQETEAQNKKAEDQPIIHQASQEIMNANSNRKDVVRGVPPYFLK